MDQISVLFGNLLKLFFDVTSDYALSIILFTIATRFILLPLTFSQIKSMNAMKVIQPKVEEINKKYKGNPQKQNEMLSKLYKENGVNPLAGCLPLLIQLPIIIGMYKVVQYPDKYVFNNSIEAYNLADKGFFWVSSLSKPDIINIAGITLPYLLPIMSAVFTVIQLKMSMNTRSSSNSNAKAESMNKTMIYIMPAMMLLWGLRFPSGLMLYWVVGTLVQILQQYFISKYDDNTRSSVNKKISKK